MKKMTIKVQLILFALFMLSLQVAIAIVGHQSLKELQTNLNSVFKVRLPSIDNLVQADRDFQQALVAERSLFAEGLSESERRQFGADYWENRNQVTSRFGIYKELAQNEKEKELISSFENNLQKWHSASDQHLNISNDGQFKSGHSYQDLVDYSFKEVSEGFEASRNQLDYLQEEILAQADQEFETATKQYETTSAFILYFSAFGIFFSFFLSWFVAKRVSGKIEAIASNLGLYNKDLTNISGDLASKSSSLASVAQEQASSVTETSSSLHEISQMIENNTTNAEKSAGLVSESEELIKDGLTVVEQLTKSIKSVESSSQEMMSSVHKNNEDLETIINAFKEIKNKANVINDIVFQTKLLSFNASVEAARAGVHGKGFSVVAEEIGNLAQESGSSANEITNLLEESLSRVSTIIEKSKKDLEDSVLNNKEKILQSVDNSEKCHTTFNEISKKFRLVAHSSNDVVEASKEQESGVGEINKAMQEINSSNSITSQSASGVEHSSTQLTAIVNQITQNINGLETLVGMKKELEKLHSDIERPGPSVFDGTTNKVQVTPSESGHSHEDEWEEFDAEGDESNAA